MRDDDNTRINERIRVPKVRVVGDEGEFLGVLLIAEAIAKAREAGLDLVEVAPNADPPVCKIIDYGKFKYEKSKKTKEAKKKQHIMHMKELKMHPKIDEHDYHFKMQHARDFLVRGDRVKATVVFRGREIMYRQFGFELLERFAKDVVDLATIELSQKMEGRNMISAFVPDRQKVKEYQHKLDVEKKRQEQAEQQAAKAAAATTTTTEKS